MFIEIFTTGGTIDKEYFDANSQYAVGEPFIIELLSELKLNMDYRITTLMKKDSLEIELSDREFLLDSIQKSGSERILITHGTDTMETTAEYLSILKNQVVVLTGSMKPGKFHKTDAVFNIAFALGACQLLPPGVYICMNGITYPWNSVTKNRREGRFEGKGYSEN